MSKALKRRDFLALMGAGGAAATLSCSDVPKQETWRPWVNPVEGSIPYEPKHYATSVKEAPGEGLWIRVVEGRAIKAEGNPDHPISGGATSAKTQSVVQGLYGAGRIKTPTHNGQEIPWNDAMALLKEKLTAAQGKVVTGLTPSLTGTQKDVWNKFFAAMGSGRHVQYDVFTDSAFMTASEKVFGVNKVPFVHLKDADFVLSLGAQFLETWGAPIAQARDYAQIMTPHDGHRAKHVQVEAKMTQTGANADTWLAANPGSETVLALALLAALAEPSSHLTAEDKAMVKQMTSGYDLARAVQVTGVSQARLARLVDELGHAHSAVVLPAEAMQLGREMTLHYVAVLLLNKAMGAIGQHINYDYGKSNQVVSAHNGVEDLVKEMAAGKVDVLIFKDVNPAYSLPSDLNFKAAMSNVGFSVALADTINETTALADLVIPVTHDLESWGEVASYGENITLRQPVMRARWQSIQAEDLLIQMANEAVEGTFEIASYRETLKISWLERFGSESGDPEAFWRAELKAGGQLKPIPEGQDLALSANLDAGIFRSYEAKVPASPVLVINESARFGDGSTADRSWLQELPDPMTGVVWDSWLEISREYAEKLGLQIGDVVKVTSGNKSIELPVFPTPTIKNEVVALATGQGHTGLTEAYNRGVNAFTFSSAVLNDGGQFVVGPQAVKLEKTNRREKVATPHLPNKGDRITQPLSGMSDDPTPLIGGHDDRDVYQTTTLAALSGDGHGDDHGHHGPVNMESDFPLHQDTDFYPDRSKDPVVVGRPDTFYQDYKWEMAVDLNRCNGCSACVTACYAENNLPVMGKDQVRRGREMSWVRIDRFVGFRDDHGELKTEVAFMPMMCQQCGNAPCESVCPSLATYHNHEGLNAMVYNRCVGTRYCSNNCVYKTRRFNWFYPEFEGDQTLQLNPDVSLRDAGVMEKCTFCIQRIRAAKDKAKDEDRLVADGELQTACQQVCPADAISFGNAMDENSTVSKHSHQKHAFKSLDNHLHTKPGVTYLKKVLLGDEKHA